MATLRSKHTARVLDAGTTEHGEPYMVQELLDGRDFAELLAYRSNRERAELTEAVLRAAGLPVTREPYRTVEGAGVNLFVDLGPGPRTLLLASHHDAVPGSPGANDNAAAVGILYALAARLTGAPPRRLRAARTAAGST